MPKRHVFVPAASRWVTVAYGNDPEVGIVHDLDGNWLGRVEWARREFGPRSWAYLPRNAPPWRGPFDTRGDALAHLLVDRYCPTPGPNRYDRPAR